MIELTICVFCTYKHLYMSYVPKAAFMPCLFENFESLSLAWVAGDKLDQIFLARSQCSMLCNLLQSVLANHSLK